MDLFWKGFCKLVRGWLMLAFDGEAKENRTWACVGVYEEEMNVLGGLV